MAPKSKPASISSSRFNKALEDAAKKIAAAEMRADKLQKQLEKAAPPKARAAEASRSSVRAPRVETIAVASERDEPEQQEKSAPSKAARRSINSDDDKRLKKNETERLRRQKNRAEDVIAKASAAKQRQ